MTDELNRLIDAAAREMTDAPVPVELRTRVVAEIRRTRALESGRRSPGAWSRKPVAWLAAAAAIILAAYVSWPERQPAAPSIVQAPVPAQGPVEQPATRGAPTTAWPERGAAARGVRAPRQAAGTPEETVASIPALAEPPALEIAPLDAAMQELPQLDAIAPLDTTALEIRPLTPFQ